MEWFYVEGEERRGPVSDAEITELNRSGKVGPSTLVWHAGWAEWRTLGNASAMVASANGMVPCVECGRPFATSELIQYEGSWICATCKPVFFQKVREGVPISRHMVYAGFWMRFLAKFVDGIILQVVGIVFGVVVSLLSLVSEEAQTIGAFITIGISFALGAFYSIYFVGKYGGTPGKMALRLRIVTADGGKVGYPLACGRYFAALLSSFPTLWVGCIMAGFDEEKRALHDRICDSRVIRLNA